MDGTLHSPAMHMSTCLNMPFLIREIEIKIERERERERECVCERERKNDRETEREIGIKKKICHRN